MTTEGGTRQRNARICISLLIFCVTLGLPLGGLIRSFLGDSAIGRLTLQDAGFLFLAVAVGWRVWRYRITWDIALVGLLNLGLVLSMLARAKTNWAEAIVHLYLLALYVVTRNLFKERDHRRTALVGLLWAFVLAFATAVVGKIVPNPVLPQHSLHLQGSFLNGSQYGSFMLVVTVPFFALWFSRWLDFRAAVEDPFDSALSRSLLSAICIAAPFLVLLASKRAALLSLMFSLCLGLAVSLRYRSARTLRGIFILGLLLVVAGGTTAGLWGDQLDQLEYFVSRMSRGLSRIDEGDQFFAHNVRSAWASFIDNPLFGDGYGGTVFRFGREEYEIHSTYLKWLGSGGLVTAIPGFLLIFGTARALVLRSRAAGSDDRYAVYLLVFFAGVALAMVYAYLPRRREFWVILAYLNAYAASHNEVSREEV